MNKLQELLLEQLPHSGFNDFSICEINPFVGKGLFYNPKNAKDPMKKGTIIGIYTGSLEPSHTNKGFCPYGYKMTNTDVVEKSAFHKLYGTPFYDAAHYRNAASYIQHAPTAAILATLDIPDNIKMQAATANLNMHVFLQFGIPIIVPVANREIQANEQLFFDYGTYWDGKSYQLFKKKVWLEGPEKDLKSIKQKLTKAGVTTPEVQEVANRNAWCLMFNHNPKLEAELLNIESMASKPKAPSMTKK